MKSFQFSWWHRRGQTSQVTSRQDFGGSCTHLCSRWQTCFMWVSADTCSVVTSEPALSDRRVAGLLTAPGEATTMTGKCHASIRYNAYSSSLAVRAVLGEEKGAVHSCQWISQRQVQGGCYEDDELSPKLPWDLLYVSYRDIVMSRSPGFTLRAGVGLRKLCVPRTARGGLWPPNLWAQA